MSVVRLPRKLPTGARARKKLARKSEQAVTRQISYASSARSRAGRAVIRVVENATGRLRLMHRAKGYQDEVAQGRDFWEVMPERYGLNLDIIGGSLDNIPQDKPLIIVSNHPYGILDGMMMGHILAKRRGDFKIMANSVFAKAEELDRIVLPVSFDDTKEAQRANLKMRKFALEYLRDGGAIGIFPGGTVSTSQKPFGMPMDPIWRAFTAKMISKSEAVVVPIFFEGHNSRLFQIASRVHVTLRMALLIKEFKRRTDEPVRVVIGQPLSRARLDALAKDPRAMMDSLRRATYDLSPTPLDSLAPGYEFEDRYRSEKKSA